jgi:hypothetical protein
MDLSMNQRSFFLVSGIIFLIIAFLHLLRIVLGWEAVIAGWIVPRWVSWLALIIAGYLGYEGLKLSRR